MSQIVLSSVTVWHVAMVDGTHLAFEAQHWRNARDTWCRSGFRTDESMLMSAPKGGSFSLDIIFGSVLTCRLLRSSGSSCREQFQALNGQGGNSSEQAGLFEEIEAAC